MEFLSSSVATAFRSGQPQCPTAPSPQTLDAYAHDMAAEHFVRCTQPTVVSQDGVSFAKVIGLLLAVVDIFGRCTHATLFAHGHFPNHVHLYVIQCPAFAQLQCSSYSIVSVWIPSAALNAEHDVAFMVFGAWNARWRC
ncbi:hypothetical protein D9758_017332 [Tetrapyrgos nigripes]|uniref:Uncharacterized protein n=1 Tax=Tetrapyrgos nigripes TaxID=182062 RepID=A0A8H5F9V3_9AGAR|nr:hypothetical protein D9758_017332 [Tetrapyrgos nigripes]